MWLWIAGALERMVMGMLMAGATAKSNRLRVRGEDGCVPHAVYAFCRARPHGDVKLTTRHRCKRHTGYDVETAEGLRTAQGTALLSSLVRRTT